MHWPFHLFNIFVIRFKQMLRTKAVANHITHDIWLGGNDCVKIEQIAAFQTGEKWAAVVDLTCEYSETATVETLNYLNLPTWDGNPPSPDEIEKGSVFILDRVGNGKILGESNSSLVFHRVKCY